MGAPFKLVGQQLSRTVPHPRFNAHTCSATGAELERWLLTNCKGGFSLATVWGTYPKTLHPFYRDVKPGEPPMQSWAAGRPRQMVLGPNQSFADLVDFAKTEHDYPTSLWVIFDLEEDALRCNLAFKRV